MDLDGSIEGCSVTKEEMTQTGYGCQELGTWGNSLIASVFSVSIYHGISWSIGEGGENRMLIQENEKINGTGESSIIAGQL